MTNNSETSSKIRPAIYSDFDSAGRQWIENYLDTAGYPSAVQKAIILALGDKYLDRLGGKDAEVQELQKAIWYYSFATKRFKEGGDKGLPAKMLAWLDRPQFKSNIDKLRGGALALHYAARDTDAFPRLVTAVSVLLIYRLSRLPTLGEYHAEIKSCA